MKKRPVILLIPSSHSRGVEFDDSSLSVSDYYARAIQAGGGLPLVAPLSLTAAEITQCASQADGVVLTGGNDVQTGLYADKLPARLKRKACPPDAGRDLLELALIDAVFHFRKPLLAICRGVQILNVAFGGTLYVDITTEAPGSLNHQQPKLANEMTHQLTLLPHSRLAKIARSLAMAVNSCHHQAVKELARPFRTVALSPDGIIEAIELAPEEARLLPYLLGVQFHPERLFDRDLISSRLFSDFIRTCRRSGEGTV